MKELTHSIFKNREQITFKKDIDENTTLYDIMNDYIEFLIKNNIDYCFYDTTYIDPDDHVNKYMAKHLYPPYKNQDRQELVDNFETYLIERFDYDYNDFINDLIRNLIHSVIDNRKDFLYLSSQISDCKSKILEEYEDLFCHNIEIKETPSEWTVCPYQDGDDEGSELGCFIEELKDNNHEEDSCPRVIKELFKSQGYEINDLFDEDKVEKSEFLKSFIEEVDNSYDYCSFLCFNVEKPYTFLADEEITVKTEQCGLINYTHGSGSILEIKLEKPFTFSLKDSLIVTEGVDSNYGYNYTNIY